MAAKTAAACSLAPQRGLCGLSPDLWRIRVLRLSEGLLEDMDMLHRGFNPTLRQPGRSLRSCRQHHWDHWAFEADLWLCMAGLL